MNDEQLLRYSRQIMLPEVDYDGQQKLLQAHVLIIGLGGLGSPVAMYLAGAGVGTLTLVDHDQVDLSNLQRQIVHSTQNIGQPKVDSARQHLQALNPTVEIRTYNHKLMDSQLDACIQAADVVVDASDNYETRFTLNRHCVLNHTPLVSGAAIRMEGQISVFDPRLADSPCYRCLYNESDEIAQTCSENGILAPLVGIIGSIQAIETIKLIIGCGQSLVGRLLVVDALYQDWRSIRLRKDPNCPACGEVEPLLAEAKL